MSFLWLNPSRVRAAALTLLLAVVGVPVAAQPLNCATGSAQDFELGLRITDQTDVLVRYQSLKTSASGSRVALWDQPIGTTGCQFVAHVGEPPTGPGRVQLPANEHLRLELYAYDRVTEQQGALLSSAYYFYCRFAGADEGRFFCPSGALNEGAAVLFYRGNGQTRVYPVRVFSGGQGDVNTYFQEPLWVLPYDLENVCPSCSRRDVPFLSPQKGPAFVMARRADPFVSRWRAQPGETWRWGPPEVTEVQLPSGYGLWTVDATFEADNMALKARPGAQWDRVLACGTTGRVDFDGVTISGAYVGLAFETRGNALRRSSITGASFGILTEGTDCSKLGLPPNPARRQVLVEESCIEDGGYGIYARNADVAINASTLSGNSTNGLRVENAEVVPYRTIIEGNGSGSNPPPGAHVFANGVLTLTQYLNGIVDRAAENRISDNTGDEIQIEEGGYGTVGLVGAPSNRVSQSGSLGTTFLIDNPPVGPTIPARRTRWWPQLSGNSTPPPGAFSNPALVDASSPLTTDPSTAAGRPGGCDTPSGLRGDGGAPPAGLLAYAGDGAPGLVVGEAQEWAEAEIQRLRAALDADPAADSAAAFVAALHGLQRMDREDVLGEQAATAATLAATRARLLDPLLSEPGRAAAEAALVAEVDQALLVENHMGSRALLTAFGPLVEDGGAAFALAFADLWLLEAEGRWADALVALAALVLRPEAADLQADLEVLEGLYEAAAGIEADTTAGEFARAAGGASASVVVEGFALGAARPNPTSGRAVVLLALAEPAEVDLAAYDALGRRVATVASGALAAGPHEAALDAASLPAGVYLLRAMVRPASGGAARILTQRLTVLR